MYANTSTIPGIACSKDMDSVGRSAASMCALAIKDGRLGIAGLVSASLCVASRATQYVADMF